MEAVLALEVATDIGRWQWLTGSRAGGIAALDLWDDDAWHSLAERQVRVARDIGALVRLQAALHFLARSHLLAGDLTAATASRRGGARDRRGDGDLAGRLHRDNLAAWRGQEELASELIEHGMREASAHGIGRTVQLVNYSAAVLNNGMGRYDAAPIGSPRLRLRSSSDSRRDRVRTRRGGSRTGDSALAGAALEWTAERAAVTPSDWALGIEALVRALASEGDAAELAYRESIEQLERTRVRVELARSRLLYGEWLRREGRRVDAREQLRVAREALLAMGAEGFAERARHELLATGEKVRKRVDETRDELTPQEAHIARLARDGRTNPEIGAELFLSPRTVEWHLKKVFTKLGISSRRALRDALPAEREPVTA